MKLAKCVCMYLLFVCVLSSGAIAAEKKLPKKLPVRKVSSENVSTEGQSNAEPANTPAAAPVAKVAAEKKPVVNQGQGATVKTESAMVYSDPDFDASVVTYFNSGKKIRVSKKIFGDYFRFFKVKLAPGQYGYIATIDVEPEEAPEDTPRVKGKKRNQDKERAKAKAKEESEREDDGEYGGQGKPLLARRYVGVLLGYTSFRENISGVDPTDNFMIYGLKITGPDLFFYGPVLDVNIALHYGAPKYYEALSTAKPSGFVLFADTLLVLPFGEGTKSLLYLAAGPLVIWSSQTVTTKNTELKLNEVNVGASFVLGGAYRLDRFAIRGEAKYMQERFSHKAFQVSIQREY